MYISKYSLISLTQSSDLVFKSSNPNGHVFEDFLMLFAEQGDIDEDNHIINVQSQQQNTKEIRYKIDQFIERHKDNDIKFFKLRSYFQKLQENEYFLLWPTEDLTEEKRTSLSNFLISLKEGVDFNLLTQQHDDLFTELKAVYRISNYGEETRTGIGEKNKERRVCRFCTRRSPEVSFKHTAHAISESLGNKKIILFEECDSCNERFGSSNGIEYNLISYLKVYGNFFGVRGKSGIPKLKGKNFILTNEGTIKLNHYLKEGESPNDANAKLINFMLETNDQIVDQDIYRTLCKFVISVLDTSLLPILQETIKWINREIILDDLPKIAMLKSYALFRQHPSLVVYQRKTADHHLPFLVGEFHYTYFTFIFIVPLTQLETQDFRLAANFDEFWRFFKHYNSTNGWIFEDFSSSTKKNLIVNINFDNSKQF